MRPPIPGHQPTCDALRRGSVFHLSDMGRFAIHFGDRLAHGRAFEFEAVGIVDDSIQNGVGKRRLADDVMPGLDG